MSSASQRQRAASAVGGKTARACDGCAQRRARWYCAADDAFLCQGCDAFVHSANPLARRHERLRLKNSSSSSLTTDDDDAAAPAWHHGFKRKARTPRPHQGKARAPGLVPELDTSGEENGEEEEDLHYRVPIFDPVLAEFCSPPPVHEPSNDAKPAVQLPDYAHASTTRGMSGILQTDAELAVDVESLLAEGIHDDDSFCIEGLIDQREDGRRNHCTEESGTMKVEPDHDMAVGNGAICHVDAEVEMSRDMLDINFDCASPRPEEDADEDKPGMATSVYGEAARVMLRLDYEAIIEAWSSNGSSPWTSGERPQFGLDDCWPEYMGVWGGGDVAWGVCGVVGAGQVDGDREARVTRYREKRRTRLFAKKIRYEVRKLNAEKRPRMKGRFVKRACFPAPVAVSY